MWRGRMYVCIGERAVEGKERNTRVCSLNCLKGDANIHDMATVGLYPSTQTELTGGKDAAKGGGAQRDLFTLSQ